MYNDEYFIENGPFTIFKSFNCMVWKLPNAQFAYHLLVYGLRQLTNDIKKSEKSTRHLFFNF